MPIVHKPAAGSIPECFAVILPPDWSEPVELSYSIASEQVEGLTGIEYRAPAHRALRIRQSYLATLEEADAAQLREMLASLAGKRLAVPLWPDAYASSTPGLHAPSYRIVWSDAGAVVFDASPTGPYAHPNVAPLLFGRLTERPTILPVGDLLWQVQIEVQEDAPWALRIDAASGTTPSTFTFTPDWSEPIEDLSRDQLRPSDLGQGREMGVGGTNGTPRWGESAGFTLTRDEAGQLLRFWVAKRGSCDEFTVPAWSQPGTATSTTPASYTARFDADRLTLRFPAPHVVETTLKLWQQVTTATAQSGNARTYLYSFTWEGGTTTRLTSWEHDLTHSAQTYAPARITKASLRRSMRPLGDECDVEIFAEEAGNPLAPLLAGESERKLSVVISEATVNNVGAVVAATEIFTGTIQTASLEGDKIVGRAYSFGGVFQRKIPPFFIQRGCNYSLFSSTCGLAKGSWAKTGTMGGTLPSSAPTFTPAVAPTGTYKDKWFAGGWLEVTGTDGAEHRRAILDCQEWLPGSPGVWIVKLNRPLPANCAGQTATAYPGCDGNYSTCKDKFSNGANFGGHPFTPNFIATSSGNATSSKVK